MYKRKYLFGLMVICFTAIGDLCYAQQTYFDTVIHRVVKDLRSRGNKTEKSITTLQSDGTWPDINYKDSAVALWSPAAHLSRTEDLALIYGKQQNERLYTGIVKSLRAWNRINPICRNWWYNEINCPQLLGQIMLLMQSSKPLPAGLQDSLLKKMQRGNMYKQTGANKLDVALHNMYRALLTRDIALMDSSVAQCFQPVVLTTASEGLQYDYSYLQHGPQLQIASYGLVFLGGEFKVASYVNGTRWQMPVEKCKVLSMFLNRAFLNSIRYRYFDFSVLGRGFSRKNSGNAGAISGWRSSINLLKRSGTDTGWNFADYDAAVKRASGNLPASYQVKPSHTQFWKGDYVQHVNTGYLFTVRTNSTRTRRTETGNGENLYGRYMSDGATNIQRTGSEYFNIFPVWEYDKIPGVTCRDYPADRPAINSWNQPGTTDFTGGVSDGLYGISTYSLNFDSVKAKKSWFFFGKQIVCLGAGIQSTAPEPITTTINQCWSRGNQVIDSSNSNIAYWQDSIGYYFQPGEHILYTNDEQKGTWKHVNSSQSGDTVRGKVFKLWIDHGINPQNAGYAYVIVPGIASNQFAQQSPFSDLKILSNTAALQAISSAKLNMLQIVFYQAGFLQSSDITVRVDKPCVVLIEKMTTAKPELYITDPSQKLKKVTVSLNRKNAEYRLPEGEYAGSTVKYIIDK